MPLVIKTIRGGRYHYAFLSYRLAKGPKSFSKYIGLRKPTEKELGKIEYRFREELIRRLSGRSYSNLLVSRDEVIKSLLFSLEFQKKYHELTGLRRRKYDIDRTVMFTLATLTTEDVDVDLIDVKNALKKTSGLTLREQISKNMLRAVESIREAHKLDSKYLLRLHAMIMATFEAKTPGAFRKKQVYLYRRGGSATPNGNRELAYLPPSHRRIAKLLSRFLDWYNRSDLNPIEKAALAHYRLYRIHPFLDGNKRICRLVFNKTLIDSNFPLINISVNKDAYFDALIVSVETADPKPFVEFALKQYYLQVKEFLAQ
jgi:Fic family protein